MKKKLVDKIQKQFSHVIVITDYSATNTPFMTMTMLRMIDNFMTNIYGHAIVRGKPSTRSLFGFRFVRNQEGTWIRSENRIYVNDPHVVEVLRSKMPKYLKFDIKKVAKRN